MPNGEIKSTPAYYPPTPSRKKSIVFVIGILVIVLAMIGVGVSLATRLWDPLWNPFRPEPEEVIEKMSTEMDSLKTIRSRTKFDISSKEEAKEVFKLSLDFTNDLDKTDSQNPKSAAEFYLNSEVEEVGIALGGENKTIGKDFYLKLTIVPSIPEFPINLNQFKDQWIKIDEESIKNLLESSGAPINTSEIEKAKEKQKEIFERFQTLIKGKKLYIIKKEFPDEKIGNLKTYHYLVALNKEEVKKLIPDLLKELIKTEIFPQPPTEAEWQEFEKEFPKKFDEFFAKIGDIEEEIWIGKKDLYLYKVKGEKEIDLSKFEESEKGKITINFEMNFSDFNKPLKIEAPKEYKGLEEILKPQIEKLPSMKPVDFVEYYNKDYSYRINYPKDWKMLEGKPANPKILHYVAFLSPDYLSSFSIDVESVSSLKEELEVIKEKSKVKEITINRCKGYEIINLAEPGMKFWMFLCKEKGYFLSCVFLNDPSICDQIVNTFIIE